MCALTRPLELYGTLLLQPKKKKITHITKNRKNNNFAIPADAAAIPPNPNTAAISAIIRKILPKLACFTSFPDESQQGTGPGLLLFQSIA
jgi:hypothetical protein